MISVSISLIFGAVGIQMVRIQNIPGAKQILDQSVAYQGVTRTIYPDRGNIYDSEGRLLAGNETVFEVGLDLTSIRQPETVAAIAASVLGLDYTTVLGYANTKPGKLLYITLDGFVDKDKITQLELIDAEYKNRVLKRNETRPNLAGLMWTPHNKRSYPEGTLASNIIGFYSFWTAQKVLAIMAWKKPTTIF